MPPPDAVRAAVEIDLLKNGLFAESSDLRIGFLYKRMRSCRLTNYYRIILPLSVLISLTLEVWWSVIDDVCKDGADSF